MRNQPPPAAGMFLPATLTVAGGNSSSRAPLDAVKMARKKMFVSAEKAKRELGFNPGPVDGALRRAVDWFQANGYV